MAEANSLRERALYAWQNRDEVAKQERGAWAARRLALLLEERLNVRVVHVDVESNTAVVDGLTFTRGTPRNSSGSRLEGDESLHLVWSCPECKQLVTSTDDITSLQNLGQQLDAGVPPHRHTQRQLEGGEEEKPDPHGGL